MGRTAEWLRAFWPRRRLRAWRYVSPRRRGAGLVVLLAMSAALLAYWRLTNDREIRRQAQAYLREATGGDWRVARARFGLLEGIELRGVELRLPGGDLPFFRAERVLLRHRPWGLLARQRLDVREIVCDGPVVRMVYDVPTRRWVYPRLRWAAGPSGGGEGGGGGAWWPPLRVPEATILVTYQDAGLALEQVEARAEIQGLPRRDNVYQIGLFGDDRDPAAGLRGTVLVNMDTGQVVPAIQVQDIALLQQLGWLKKLGLRGRVTVTGRWDPRTGEGTLDANFDGGAMELPEEFASLRLHSIRGTLSVDANGVTARDLTGQIEQAGDARFRLSGRYEGLEANGPFDLQVRVDGAELPRELPGEGPLARLVREVRRDYEFSGKLGLRARVARGADGGLALTGTADANALTVMDRRFPYELRRVQAEVAFTDQTLEFRRFRGAHGTGRVEMEGAVRFGPGGRTYDLHIRATDVELDRELHDALWPEHRRVWDAVAPTGRLGVRARVHKDAPDQPEKQEVTVVLGGAASAEYVGFPYPLRNVFGEVELAGETVTIRSVSCSSPKMSCQIEGVIRLDAHAPDAAGEADLTIHARLPLDETLEEALGEAGRGAFAALRPGGTAQNIVARVRGRPGQAVRYDVSAALEDASFTFDRFPYQITGASGELHLEPNRATIRRLVGRHGDAPVFVRGAVLTGGDDVGIELHVEANALSADQDLFAALPASVQRVWKELSPGGRGDVELDLRWPSLRDGNTLDYVARLRARDMQVRYAGLPYTLRGVAGTVKVLPGRVELEDVSAREGAMKLAVRGTVTTDDAGDRAELSLRAEDLPLSEELLAALPFRSAAFLGRLRPGGTCHLDLKKLVLVGGAAPVRTSPAREQAVGLPAGQTPATREAAAPLAGPIADWQLEGELALRDAEVDLGGGAKLTGAIVGRLARQKGDLQIDANLFLASLTVSQRGMTEVRGRVWKEAGSPLIHIDDILGKAYGGRLSGFAEVRLREPMEYGLRIVAEGMDLNEVFNASVSEPNQRMEVEGRLDATIEMKATEGAAPQTRPGGAPAAGRPVQHISGLLHLSQAKVQKVPVLVDQFQPVLLALPEGSFSDGVVEYTLKEDKVLFREIHLRGPGLSIVGSGTMNLKNEALKLTFLSRPGIVPRMDSLADELIGGVLREIVEVQVTGTLKTDQTISMPSTVYASILPRA